MRQQKMNFNVKTLNGVVTLDSVRPWYDSTTKRIRFNDEVFSFRIADIRKLDVKNSKFGRTVNVDLTVGATNPNPEPIGIDQIVEELFS